MKRMFNLLCIMFFLILVLINVYLIGRGIKLSDEISIIEKEIEELRKENTLLESKLAMVDSLEYVSSMAANLNFIIKSEPFTFEPIKQAFKN